MLAEREAKRAALGERTDVDDLAARRFEVDVDPAGSGNGLEVDLAGLGREIVELRVADDAESALASLRSHGIVDWDEWACVPDSSAALL